MKKSTRIISILLVVTFLMCGLAGCGGGSNDGESTTEPTTPSKTEFKEISLSSATRIGDVAEIDVINVYTGKEISPPKQSGFHTSYMPVDGMIYVVVVMDVKNLGTVAASADDILSTAMVIKDIAYKPYIVVETEGGSDLSRGSSVYIQALDTARVYYMFAVPVGVEMENMMLLIENGDVTYTTEVSVNKFESKVETIEIGSVITDDDTISLTVDSIKFQNILKPPKPDGYYHYYEAGSGKTYLIVKMTVKNLKGTDMMYDDVAGVSCVYNNKYNYSFFTVFREDGGRDLSDASNIYGIPPLDKGVVYYLAEVPTEVKNGPVEISLYIAGKYYKYTM